MRSACRHSRTSSSARVRARHLVAAWLLALSLVPLLTIASPCAEMKYLVFEIAPSGKEIIVTKRGDSKSYDDFVGEFDENSCRYAVYDFEYEKGEGIRNKLCFYAWSVALALALSYPTTRPCAFAAPAGQCIRGASRADTGSRDALAGAPTRRRSAKRWCTPRPRTRSAGHSLALVRTPSTAARHPVP